VEKPRIKDMMNTSILELGGLEIKNGIKLAVKNQSIQNNEQQQREFVVNVQMNKQHIQFNMENPEADSQKGRPSNSAIFLLNNTELDVCIKENHYRLERDEEAFIKSLRNNMGNQAKMTQFLNTKTGSDGMDRTSGNQKGLDDIMKKKKVPTNHMNPKTLFNSTVSFVDQLNLA